LSNSSLESSDNISELSVLGEFLEDLNYLDEVLGDNNNESSNSDDSEHHREIRKRKRERLLPFYAKRKDVLDHFDDEKIRQTFRFDRPSIQFITGSMLYYFSSLWLPNELKFHFQK
jgi:hypothetical protein